jgi:hypothetical protein
MANMKKLWLALIIVALAACSYGPPKRIYPPKASVQELVAGANGQWTLKIRVENFSTVPMTFSAVDAKLTVAGQDAGRVAAQTALTVGPESADVFTTTMTPATTGKIVVANALAARKTVRYVLTGKITSREPQRDFDFTFESALSPVPGLDGMLR